MLTIRPAELRARADEALRIAAVEPAAAIALAQGVRTVARRERAWELVSLSERTLGVAAMQQSRLDDAITHLRVAVETGRRAHATAATGEARMSLASALLLHGEPGRSFRQIETALTELDGVPAARARTQRAAMLQELGQFDDALEDLRRALPVLRRAGDVQWATRALSNRGLLRISRREFGAARADLLAAQELSREHGLTLPDAIVEHNLAWLESQRGEVPEALRHLAAAEQMFAELGMATGSILTDRAELLLSVRLLGEAMETARAAVAADRDAGRVNHLPESQLLLSTTALVAGDPDEALDAAQEALRVFQRLGRPGWVALARFARIQARVAAGRRVTPAQCRRAAEELDRAGWRVPALEALLLAGTLSLERGEVAQARTDLARAGRVRRVGPADARARAWLAEALLREADGRPGAALRALRAGLRVLEEHRATMGATELRAHVSLHRGDLARSGLRLALESGQARRVLWWAESSRTTAAMAGRVGTPSDPVLADLLAQLRAVMSSIGEQRAADDPAAPAVRRQVALERRIRDHTRQAAADTGSSRFGVDVRTLQETLGEASLVEFVSSGDALLAVTVNRRAVRLHELGPVEPVAAELRQVSFALRRLAAESTSPTRAEGAGRTLARAGRRLDDFLLAPLRASIRDGALVVVPNGVLQGVPWALVPSCAGRPVSVSPSAALWRAAAATPVQAPRRVAVVAGPGLPGAYAEALAVGERYPGSALLVEQDATADRVSVELDGADLAHLSTHGLVRGDNPMFSSLSLADGPFTVYDLERLRAAPRHVVLAACDTGHSTVVGHGEILGFTAALMHGGTSTLVAPVVPVGDAQTVDLMLGYHDQLRQGRAPGEALAAAQTRLLDAADVRAMAAAASFVCLGHGGGTAQTLAPSTGVGTGASAPGTGGTGTGGGPAVPSRSPNRA